MKKKKLNTYVLAFKTYFQQLSGDKQKEVLKELMNVHLFQQKEKNASKQRIKIQSEEECEYSEICAMLD